MTTFYADISSWQQPVNSSYPYPMLAFRADFGTGYDSNVDANWGYCRDTAAIQIAMAYVVFQPGQGAAILGRLKAKFGTPPAKLVVMIDMESGSGFAGPGDHSAEANTLAGGIASWLGGYGRVFGYANAYDWASCWSNRSASLKRIVASYSSEGPPAGSYGWQYYGGMDYATPAGYPRSCPPFGSNVDLNAIQRDIAQIVADCSAGGEIPDSGGETPIDPGGDWEMSAQDSANLAKLVANDIPLSYKQNQYNRIVQTQTMIGRLETAVNKLVANDIPLAYKQHGYNLLVTISQGVGAVQTVVNKIAEKVGA